MYSLNAKQAKQADQTGAYLTDTGKYTGIFTRAEKLVSKNKGTHGIGFTFMAENKQSTRFDIWVRDGGGQDLMGMKSLMAIMACIKVKNITPTTSHIERYDYEARQSYTEEAPIFAELMHKPIGILLRSTEYEKMKDNHKTGETGWRLEFAGTFQAGTELTATEVLESKTIPEKLEKMVAMLADRPLRANGALQKTSSLQNSVPKTQQAQTKQAQRQVDPDDDIPF